MSLALGELTARDTRQIVSEDGERSLYSLMILGGFDRSLLVVLLACDRGYFLPGGALAV